MIATISGLISSLSNRNSRHLESSSKFSSSSSLELARESISVADQSSLLWGITFRLKGFSLDISDSISE
jgi:hypothetical protein